jgi:hypothetical protein
MREPDLTLDIEELVLDGFDDHLTGSGGAIDRSRIASAVQSELTRLFAERGVPPSLRQGGSITALDGGQLDSAPGSGPETVGAQIARALFRGVSQ